MKVSLILVATSIHVAPGPFLHVHVPTSTDRDTCHVNHYLTLHKTSTVHMYVNQLGQLCDLLENTDQLQLFYVCGCEIYASLHIIYTCTHYTLLCCVTATLKSPKNHLTIPHKSIITSTVRLLQNRTQFLMLRTLYMYLDQICRWREI